MPTTCPNECISISGTVYGVALNTASAIAFASRADGTRFGAGPKTPVMFIKPRNTWLAHGRTVRLPQEIAEIEVQAALALVFARDLRSVAAEEVYDAIAGYTLAIDITEVAAGFFRPPIREKCRDGFLPVGPAIVLRDAILNPDDIVVRLEIDGEERAQISMAETLRPVAKVIEEVSGFMTLRAGDVLLVVSTVPGIRAAVGNRIAAHASEIGRLECMVGVEEEGLA
jgi:5-oxopent-3-ene-1,2,5-tricarboxylate decarboxylase / 2-hydroxyhepta-2,4-diene-1,7-dioate isomerase